MSEKYTEEQAAIVRMLVRRAFKQSVKRGLSYRTLAPILKSDPSTVHRWFHGKTTPSQHHVEWIKRFLGYSEPR